MKIGSEYNLFYGAVVNGPGSLSKICRATSTDGKTFTRVLNADGLSGLFTEGDNSLIRDPMVIRIGDDFHCYYCDTPQRKKGYINVRTSTDLKTWSESKQPFHPAAWPGPASLRQSVRS